VRWDADEGQEEDGLLVPGRQIEVALPASAALLRGSSSPRRARSPIVPVAALCFVPSCGMEASSQYQEIAVHRARPQEHLRYPHIV